MTLESLLTTIDAEIVKWCKARAAIREIVGPAPQIAADLHRVALASQRTKALPAPIVARWVVERPKAPSKPKRHLSKAGRAAIVKAAKARWAKVKAAKKAKKK
jgi:hypothetical protein